MTTKPIPISELEFSPVTPGRWRDLEIFFGEHGAGGGCWCMWWRLTDAEFKRQVGEANKKAMKKIVDSGEVPGILAYVGDEPIGWCSLGPRENFGRLERSHMLRRIDNQPVWSIVCFYVAKSFRRRGVMESLLMAAIDYARTNGARIVEGYPVEFEGTSKLDAAYTGVVPLYEKLGFVEVLRRSDTRPIMRYFVGKW
jgi:GNAT superfamily N-acetyltransferase